MNSSGYCRLCGKIKDHFCCQSCYEQDATKSASKAELGRKISVLQTRIAELETALATTTNAYESALNDIDWQTSDDHPASWHALIVTNRQLLENKD